MLEQKSQAWSGSREKWLDGSVEAGPTLAPKARLGEGGPTGSLFWEI